MSSGLKKVLMPIHMHVTNDWSCLKIVKFFSALSLLQQLPYNEFNFAKRDIKFKNVWLVNYVYKKYCFTPTIIENSQNLSVLSFK